MALVDVIPDLGGSFAYRLRAGARARIGLARGRGSAAGSTGRAVAWLLVEGGEGELAVGTLTARVGGRDDVFEGAGWSAVLGPGTPFAVRGNVRYTIAWRAWDGPLDARVIDPADVVEEGRGGGPDARLVRTYVPRGPLICGETLNEPGRWSSWPPHRHEQEEAYLYRFDPANGFGVQVLMEEGGERATVIRDGDVQRIRSGYHPVVAAPAATMYYLWALAGEEEILAPETHPRYG